MPLVRITITIPKDLVAAADRRARELDRSRSWVVAEAVRRVSEASPSPYPAVATNEVAEARHRHLLAELALPAAQRLLRAEELGRLAQQAQQRRPRHQIIGFDSYEDYYEWKKTKLIGG